MRPELKYKAVYYQLLVLTKNSVSCYLKGNVSVTICMYLIKENPHIISVSSENADSSYLCANAISQLFISLRKWFCLACGFSYFI